MLIRSRWGAVELAAERGISNASFEKARIEDYPFEPRAWDITLFMRVWGQGEGRARSLMRRLRACSKRRDDKRSSRPESPAPSKNSDRSWRSATGTVSMLPGSFPGS